MRNDILERVLEHLEQEILAVPDSELLKAEGLGEVAAAARIVVAGALADRARRATRRGVRAARRAPVDRRAMVRQLLVASARARDLVGTRKVEGLSDAEVEAILARFVDAGLLPPDNA